MTQLRRPAQQYLLVDAGLPGAGVHITQLRSLLLGISCGIIGGLGWIQPEQASRSGPGLVSLTESRTNPYFLIANAITNMTGQLKVSMGLNITFTSTAS